MMMKTREGEGKTLHDYHLKDKEVIPREFIPGVKAGVKESELR